MLKHFTNLQELQQYHNRLNTAIYKAQENQLSHFIFDTVNILSIKDAIELKWILLSWIACEQGCQYHAEIANQIYNQHTSLVRRFVNYLHCWFLSLTGNQKS